MRGGGCAERPQGSGAPCGGKRKCEDEDDKEDEEDESEAGNPAAGRSQASLLLLLLLLLLPFSKSLCSIGRIETEKAGDTSVVEGNGRAELEEAGAGVTLSGAVRMRVPGSGAERVCWDGQSAAPDPAADEGARGGGAAAAVTAAAATGGKGEGEVSRGQAGSISGEEDGLGPRRAGGSPELSPEAAAAGPTSH